jgi:hypothetical protein
VAIFNYIDVWPRSTESIKSAGELVSFRLFVTFCFSQMRSGDGGNFIFMGSDSNWSFGPVDFNSNCIDWPRVGLSFRPDRSFDVCSGPSYADEIGRYDEVMEFPSF